MGEKTSAYFDQLRPEMMEFVPAGTKSVLDVGCGTGRFGEAIKQRNGAVVWGVEPDPQACSEAAGRLDKAIQGLFDEKLELPPSHFDCIVFNDVLEHMIYPEEALKLCRKLLVPGGIIVASIPNVRYVRNLWLLILWGDWRYEDSGGILDSTHLRFFTRKSMIAMIEGLSGEILVIKGIHPKPLKSFTLLNILMLGLIRDMRYMQFAVVFKFKEATEVLSKQSQ